jgi:MATE family multidrug resistance protein
MLFVALFQVPDGLQVGTAGALRGFKDANVPMALNFAAYWLIGFPAAWWFGIRLGAGPSGIWAGLIAGLVTCAVFLILRYRHITRAREAAIA